MNEEEIEILEELSEQSYFGDLPFLLYADLIGKLIANYNKEKEKREIAEENHKVLSLDLGKALKELGLYKDTIIADELVLEINKRYISKGKIIEKIKEYDGLKEIDMQAYEEQIKPLKELLEEE